MVALFLARVAVQMGVTQIFWGEFADTEAIRARYAVCGRWCKFVPDCSAISISVFADFLEDCCNLVSKFSIGGKSLSDESNALVMSSQVYAHASERQSQSSDSGGLYLVM